MNKQQGFIVAFSLLAAIAFLGGLFLGRIQNAGECGGISVDTVKVVEVFHDTMYIDKPVPVASRELKDSIRILWALNDAKKMMIDSLLTELYGNDPMDTIEVVVPREQKEYGDSTYRAWVSGYDPALDSIQIYNKTVVNTITNTVVIHAKKNHWGVGIQAGMGVGVHDNMVFTTPYVGVGLTYTIFSF